MARSVESTCPTRKAQFESRARARQAMRTKSARLRAFRCDLCSRWHLANPEKR